MQTIVGAHLPGTRVILWEYEDGIHHLSHGEYALDTEDTDKALEEFDRLLREAAAVAFQDA